MHLKQVIYLISPLGDFSPLVFAQCFTFARYKNALRYDFFFLMIVLSWGLILVYYFLLIG